MGRPSLAGRREVSSGANLVIKHSDAFKSNEGSERDNLAPKPDPDAKLFAARVSGLRLVTYPRDKTGIALV
jgi:hypothetical protein